MEDFDEIPLPCLRNVCFATNLSGYECEPRTPALSMMSYQCHIVIAEFIGISSLHALNNILEALCARYSDKFPNYQARKNQTS